MPYFSQLVHLNGFAETILDDVGVDTEIYTERKR